MLAASVDRIGLSQSHMGIIDSYDRRLLDERLHLPEHSSAIQTLFTWLQNQGYGDGVMAIGHRVVHGGPRYAEPERVTPELVSTLERLVPIDPDHLPQALAAIEASNRMFPGVPQVACFDTAFHRRMPRVAQTYALPYRFTEEGVLRYGFHGLSYESIMDQLATLDPGASRGRIVIAHLGNGSSMAAVRDGKGIDTTMGFTPTGGLVMGTRSGDLDPGVLLYLLQAKNMTAQAVSSLVNKEAGLLGVSGVSGDMQDLLAATSENSRAAEAIELFCYQAKKFLGALAAALGGLDTVIFTAGIGEHAPEIRSRICSGLEFLRVQLDTQRNRNNSPIVSNDGSGVTVRVMPTDEDLMIARHTWHVLNEKRGRHVPV